MREVSKFEGNELYTRVFLLTMHACNPLEDEFADLCHVDFSRSFTIVYRVVQSLEDLLHPSYYPSRRSSV